jgi:6-phosphogluconate dehydrogenase
MIGGEPEIVKRLDPIFCALAPGLGAAMRTPVTNGDPSSVELGYLHCAPTGAGHFVKMVHHGIEDWMMPSYANGRTFSSTPMSGRQPRPPTPMRSRRLSSFRSCR